MDIEELLKEGPSLTLTPEAAPELPAEEKKAEPKVYEEEQYLTEEEKKQTEDLVNKWIQEALPVTVEKMKKEDAVKSGAECMFIEKYPDVVTVYTIGNVSKELCGGPHVKNTSELGKFKIKKEEASSAGVRRIKAILEKGI